ncbi:carbohydrate esterase family 5 protein, partial [Saccharata proteae CBS 121410]
CATGVHIIVARASTEAPGTGIIGAVANNISSQVPGSDIAAVNYPATIQNVQNYASSENQGVIAMTNQVQAYVQMCPSTKIVLLGYSQGGEVTGDVLCGSIPNHGIYANKPTSTVVAAITMGSPAHVTGLPWDVGTSTTSGIFPRLNTTACLPYTNRLQEYCDTDDYYCASGTNAGSVHTGYVDRYGGVAAGYVVAKAKAAG